MAFKYPKITGILIAIALAYFLFSQPEISDFILNLGSLGYFGAFIAGIFYTFGFTSPFSAGFFFSLNPSSIWLAGIVGGLGALFGDMFIFALVRISFEEEFRNLKQEKFFASAGNFLEKTFGRRLNEFSAYIIAMILIASPLPDEAGIVLIAGLTKIKASAMAFISFVFNTTGILIILSL